MQVNAETLQMRIKSLQARGNAEYALPLTINEEYQLEAYKMLLKLLSEKTCGHAWSNSSYTAAYCTKCGEHK